MRLEPLMQDLYTHFDTRPLLKTLLGVSPLLKKYGAAAAGDPWRACSVTPNRLPSLASGQNARR